MIQDMFVSQTGVTYSEASQYDLPGSTVAATAGPLLQEEFYAVGVSSLGVCIPSVLSSTKNGPGYYAGGFFGREGRGRYYLQIASCPRQLICPQVAFNARMSRDPKKRDLLGGGNNGSNNMLNAKNNIVRYRRHVFNR